LDLTHYISKIRPDTILIYVVFDKVDQEKFESEEETEVVLVAILSEKLDNGHKSVCILQIWGLLKLGAPAMTLVVGLTPNMPSVDKF